MTGARGRLLLGEIPPFLKEVVMDRWEFYTDPKGEWRWRRVAPNGNIVGSSSESYKNRADCEANARRNGWPGK